MYLLYWCIHWMIVVLRHCGIFILLMIDICYTVHIYKTRFASMHVVQTDQIHRLVYLQLVDDHIGVG